MKGIPIAKRPSIVCPKCGNPQRLSDAGNCAEHWSGGVVCLGSGKPPALHCDECGQIATRMLALIAHVGEPHYRRVGFGARFVTCGMWVAP